MMKYSSIIFVFITFIACQNNISTNTIYSISPKEMSELLLMDAVQLIDVRSADEYSEGHIESAHNINYSASDFKEKIRHLDKEKPICVYCKKGGRSAKAAQVLKEQGFKKVYDLNGGVTNWKAEGLSLKTKQ